MIEQIRDLKYDMLSLSAHKFRGPQGIGVLVLREKKYKLPPVKNISFGGQQEHGIRPGTIPVALVAGMGKACELALEEHDEEALKNRVIKEELLKLLNSEGVQYELNGELRFSVDTTLNVCFNEVSSEALMIATKRFCAVSNGSACTSKSYDHSYVLVAMGVPVDKIESSIRISWGPGVSKEEVVHNFKEMLDVVKMLAV